MRPIYESQADIKNEIDVANTLTSLWNCEFKKIKRSYHVDWMVLRNGNPVAFAELKCRFVTRNTYPTFMLSLEKWMRGKELSKEVGVPFVVVVRWEDGLFFHTAESCDVTYGFGGRTDRNDSEDVEPVVYIPTTNFKFVEFRS